MILIGEKLNSSIPSALEAFKSQDANKILDIINSQSQNMADYIDINTAMLEDNELNVMLDTIRLVLDNTDKGIMIDTVNMAIAKEALAISSKRATIINSISLSTDITPLKGLDLSNIGVVAMPTDEDCIPDNPKKRFEMTKELVAKLLSLGFIEENIYADILIETTAVNQKAGIIALDTLKLIKSNLPKVQTTCGSSNISFGLPMRKHINCAYLAMLIYNGIDSAILDVNNKDILSTIYASELLIGKDEYCMNYIDFIRR